MMLIYLAKEVVISKESIESLSERLSEKIVDKFLMRIQSKESSLGIILKYHLREVLKMVGREEREVERAERIKRLDEININPFTIPEELEINSNGARIIT
jgi:hypothetical protein